MIEIEKPRIDCEQLAEDGSYGKFVVEPLERGYGTTRATLCAASCCRLCLARQRPASRSLVCSTSFLRFRALRKTLPKSC